MAKVEQQFNLKESLRLHAWAAKVWWGIEPKLFLSTGLTAIFQKITPYVVIWFSAQIINELAGARDPATLWRWVAMTVAVTGVMGLVTALLKRWKEAVHSLEQKYEDRLLNEKMVNMDYCATESASTRDILYEMQYHMMGNVYGFTKIHSWYFDRLIGSMASVTGAVALSVSLFARQVPEGSLTVLNHPLIAVLVVLLCLGGILLPSVLTARVNHYEEQLWPRRNMFNRFLNCFAMLGLRRTRQLDVRIYAQQNIARENLENNNPNRGRNSSVGRLLYGPIGLYSAASTMAGVLLVGVIYVFVCLKAWGGAFGVGSVTQYVGAITAMCGSITELFDLLGDIRVNAGFLDAIRRYLEIPNDMYQGSLTTEKRSDRQYEVEFRDVSFRYPGSDLWALRHVNMKFRVGSRLAVVGMNGSGKTTFIKLLCRLYDPTEGEILLNGINIRKYRYDEYLNIFSVVFQDFQLVSLPLGQNVAGCADVDAPLAEDCLRKAGFGERLDAMPKGLDTWLYKDLSKDGVEVSGGEAQKIAIARALYKDAPFIILDEPTAALDPLAEAEIYSRFNDIVDDKTAIYISHRLSSCKFCDEIVVFHEGAVIQQGSHEALVADEQGKYHELWNAQAQYYTEKKQG